MLSHDHIVNGAAARPTFKGEDTMRRISYMLALCWAMPSHALDRPLSPGELCQRSSLVIVGEVTDQEAEFAEDGSGRIETWVDVAVLRTLRGQAPADSLRLVLPGGALAGLRLTVEDTPALQTDASYLFLLSPRAAGQSWRVVGGEAGALPTTDVQGASLMAFEGCHAP